MSDLGRNVRPSRLSGFLPRQRLQLLSVVGLGGQSQHSESRAQSKHVASCSLALGPVKSLKVLNQIRITKIRWDTLDDARGFDIENVPCAHACSASRLLCNEADRVGPELQPTL